MQGQNENTLYRQAFSFFRGGTAKGEQMTKILIFLLWYQIPS